MAIIPALLPLLFCSQLSFSYHKAVNKVATVLLASGRAKEPNEALFLSHFSVLVFFHKWIWKYFNYSGILLYLLMTKFRLGTFF